jgi:hypothetical protein
VARIVVIKVRYPNDDKARQAMAKDSRYWSKVYREWGAGKCPETRHEIDLLMCHTCEWKKRIDGERVLCNLAGRWLTVGK